MEKPPVHQHKISERKRKMMKEMWESNFLRLTEDVGLDQLTALRLATHIGEMGAVAHQMGYTEGYQDREYKYRLGELYSSESAIK